MDFHAETEDMQLNTAHRVFWDRTDDTGDQQLVDYAGLHDEQHTRVLRIMPHGLASHSPPESEGVVLALGTRDMPVLLGGESPKHRPRNLPVGATKLYDAADGFVYLDADGNLHAKVTKGATIESGEAVTVKTKKLTLDAPEIIIKGDIEMVGGFVQAGIHRDSNGLHK